MKFVYCNSSFQKCQQHALFLYFLFHSRNYQTFDGTQTFTSHSVQGLELSAWIVYYISQEYMSLAQIKAS